MARPRVSNDKKKTRLISIRLTHQMYEKLKSACKKTGKSFSYFLERGLKNKPPEPRVLIDKNIEFQLRYHGGNLNQIATRLNCDRKVEDSELRTLYTHLFKFYMELKSLIKSQNDIKDQHP